MVDDITKKKNNWRKGVLGTDFKEKKIFKGWTKSKEVTIE